MSLANKLKTGIALTGLGIGNLFYNTGCQTIQDGGDAVMDHIWHPQKLLDKPGVKGTLAAVAMGIATGNTTNQDTINALNVGGALAANQADYERNAVAHQGGSNGNVGYSPVQRDLRIYEAEDSNGDGMINVKEYRNEKYSLDRTQLMALAIDNDRKPTFVARIVIYKSGVQNPVADWKNMLMEKNNILTVAVSPERELNGPGEYSVVIYDNDNVTAGKSFRLN